jgi:hypothetical protein
LPDALSGGGGLSDALVDQLLPAGLSINERSQPEVLLVRPSRQHAPSYEALFADVQTRTSWREVVEPERTKEGHSENETLHPDGRATHNFRAVGNTETAPLGR